MSQTIYDFQAKTIDGEEVSLADYKDKTLLIVNVASKCGFTNQYEGLEELYKSHQDEGFVILGFPCNQFGFQEPGNEEEIKGFCRLRYGVSFPMFAKVDVNGDGAHPLFKYLKKEAPGLLGTEAVKWNFTKFLVDKTGTVIKRYASADTPQMIAEDLPKYL